MKRPAVRLEVVAPFLVFAAAVICFLPALDNEFVFWDDPVFLTRNLRYRGLGWNELRWMFGNTLQAVYQPLAWMTLGLDYVLWGMEAGGYHLSSVLWHGALSVCVYFLFRRLLELARPGKSWATEGALFAALLYCVHPLRVEAVAWASERRELVGGFFWALAATLYLGRGRGGKPLFWGPFICFVLALLAKGTMLTLPLVLLVMDWHPLDRLKTSRDFFSRAIEKAPYFALSLAFGLLGVRAIADLGEPGVSLASYGLSARVAQLSYSFAFYPLKTIWPTSLAHLYEMPAELSLLEGRYVGGFIFLLAVIGVCARSVRRLPAICVATAWYVSCLIPVVGVVKYGPHIAADRYANLATLGFYAVFAGGAAHYLSRVSVRARAAAGLAGVVLVFSLCALSRKQIGYWRDSRALWAHASQSVARSGAAHVNLSVLAEESGEVAAAIDHAKKAVALWPTSTLAHENLAGILARRGRWVEAAEILRSELSLGEGNAKARASLALALMKAGDAAGAEAEYRAALAAEPSDARAHYNFGAMLGRLGRTAEAREQYEAALRADPSYGEAHNNLGLLLAADGRRREAVEHYRRALATASVRALAHLNWGNVLSDEGRLEEAARHYREAVRLDDALVSARFNLANVLARGEKFVEARTRYREVLERAPGHAAARRNLRALERR